MGSHRRLYLALSLVTLTIVSTQILASYYYLQKSSSAPASSGTVTVNTLINYGNTTTRWYNESSVPAIWNFYRLTMYITKNNTETKFYPTLNEHFITAINGVTEQGQLSWAIWTFCQKQDAWIYSQVGADQIQLANGQSLAWAYEAAHEPPIPGAKTADSCS